mmetsp:Transcript_5814/g.22669  ORF Transcript_5814/g.22669 Transcript_5814/m.22669 type:complete len:306 (+) Transcript_5814:1499-2416(+)
MSRMLLLLMLSTRRLNNLPTPGVRCSSLLYWMCSSIRPSSLEMSRGSCVRALFWRKRYFSFVSSIRGITSAILLALRSRYSRATRLESSGGTTSILDAPMPSFRRLVNVKMQGGTPSVSLLFEMSSSMRCVREVKTAGNSLMAFCETSSEVSLGSLQISSGRVWMLEAATFSRSSFCMPITSSGMEERAFPPMSSTVSSAKPERSGSLLILLSCSSSDWRPWKRVKNSDTSVSWLPFRLMLLRFGTFVVKWSSTSSETNEIWFESSASTSSVGMPASSCGNWLSRLSLRFTVFTLVSCGRKPGGM